MYRLNGHCSKTGRLRQKMWLAYTSFKTATPVANGRIGSAAYD